jgi:feruloyl esterase
VRIPDDWNTRLLFQGGGGIDGSLRAAVGANTRGNPDALTLGFAVVSTDGGHDLGSRRDASFGLERKALIDYGYNSVELAGTLAKVVVREVTGAYPSHSYFLGASNGGRQGLQAAMRHPNLFDGIIAGTPIKEQTRGHLATAWSLVTLAKIAPQDDQGRPLLGKVYSDADLALINADITAQCDALDGLEDGVVDSAKMCAYDISKLVCADAQSDGCITKEQAWAYTTIHAGPVNSKGEELYAPFPYDAGADFKLWHLGDAEEWPNNGRRARNQSIKMVFRQPGDPNFDPWRFDFDDLEAVERASQFVDAKSHDIDAFQLGGGKLILYHSMGDSGISAVDTVRWFEGVEARYGRAQTDDFARFYLLPGLGHGRTGIGPHKFPALEAIVAWVEKGRAPDMQITGGTPERTRPMCDYPTYVMWDDASADWTCKE